MSTRPGPERRDRGAALVEFAIVLPVFLMFILAAIDWGWFFVVRDAAANAAREGARAGVVSTGAVTADSKARADSVLAGMLPTTQTAKCQANPTLVGGALPAIRVDVTCVTGSLSGVTAIGALSWATPPQVTVGAEMRR